VTWFKAAHAERLSRPHEFGDAHLVEQEHAKDRRARRRNRRPDEIGLSLSAVVMKDMTPDQLAEIIVDTIKKTLDGPRIGGKFAELDARIAHLEARPLQKWAGTHAAGVQYAEASLVTRGGSLWAAPTTTTTTPGDAGSDWRLIVKKGHG
jgi:hypothetical protein